MDIVKSAFKKKIETFSLTIQGIFIQYYITFSRSALKLIKF